MISHSEAASDGWGCRRVKIRQAAYLKWQWCFGNCMCVCVCLCCFLAWPSGPEVTAAALLFQSKGMVTVDHTHTHTEEKDKRQTKWWRVEEKNSIIVVFFVALIFLDPSVSLIQHSPKSLPFSLFHQRTLFHMSWFHTKHTLTVNLHPLTTPIHHHSGYVWAYTVHRASLGSAGYYFKGCCVITDHLVALWYLESNHKQFSKFFFYFFIYLLL